MFGNVMSFTCDNIFYINYIHTFRQQKALCFLCKGEALICRLFPVFSLFAISKERFHTFGFRLCRLTRLTHCIQSHLQFGHCSLGQIVMKREVRIEMCLELHILELDGNTTLKNLRKFIK